MQGRRVSTFAPLKTFLMNTRNSVVTPPACFETTPYWSNRTPR